MASKVIDLITDVWPSIKALASKRALSYGDYRGGLAIGFEDTNGIWSLCSEINPTLPSRWGKESDKYHLNASLKLATHLTVKLAPEGSPFYAVDPGGVIRFDDRFGLWIGIAYSGHNPEEDTALAMLLLNCFSLKPR